jgi:hypothetical protein
VSIDFIAPYLTPPHSHLSWLTAHLHLCHAQELNKLKAKAIESAAAKLGPVNTALAQLGY